MPIEYREVIGGETRATDDEQRTVEAKVVSYGVGPDTFNTTWQRGVFTRSLQNALPAVCWGHDHRTIIGGVTGYRDEPDGLYVTLRMADFDAVPKAKEAYSLLRDGFVKGWSFGFANGKASPDPEHRGALRFTDADLYEVSPVLRASVPSTRTVSVRSADGAQVAVQGSEDLAALIRGRLDEGTRAMTITVGDDGSVNMGGQAATADTGDEDVPSLVRAVDGCLDQALQLLDTGDSGDREQATALLTAAQTAVDELGAALGVDDPDDTTRGVTDLVDAGNPDDDSDETRAVDKSVGGGVDRSKLKPGDFVFPDDRAFPIVEPKDVADAVSSWGRYKGSESFDTFKSRLTALARRKGAPFVARLPEAWNVGTRSVDDDIVDTLRRLQDRLAAR